MSDVELPKKLDFLFKPKRYKIAYGGRGSSKSWSFARALILKGTEQELRIFCGREVQKSIKESVHHLLVTQIQALGLGAFFTVTDNSIKGRNGTEFIFAGLANHTVESIKSYEDIDLCWVEEAQTVSKKSWSILIPTIRKTDSEIWISFNPQLDTDETWVRFVENTPDDSYITAINWQDNPWFSDVLEKERQQCLKSFPDDYDNIWEGKCKATVDGAIYAKEIMDAQEAKRIRPVPYDPMFKVHTVWDLGWNDKMAIIFVQKVASELRIINYIEDSHLMLADYVGILDGLRYNYGVDYIPHDGAQRDFKTGKSTEEILNGLGRNVEVIPIANIEEGIRLSRMAFPRCYFDKERANELVSSLKRYRRVISTSTEEAGRPLHDANSHGADAFRYLATVADQLTSSGVPMQPINYNVRPLI